MSSEYCVLTIKVIPNASANEIVGWLGESLKVRVQAPPEKGKANRALLKFLSKQLRCNKNQIELESGEYSSQKCLRFNGTSLSQLLNKLGLQEHHG